MAVSMTCYLAGHGVNGYSAIERKAVTVVFSLTFYTPSTIMKVERKLRKGYYYI